MKWRNVFITFTIALPSSANGKSFGLRGESSKAPEEDDSMAEQLNAENEALMKRNKHLEGLMQMARATSMKHEQDAPMQSVSNADVLSQEISDLKSKLQAAEADKKALVQTLQRMLSKDSTLAFQKQAEKAQQMKFSLELKCGQEREALQKKLQDIQHAAQTTINEANGKCDDTRELAQTLQEQNQDLQKSLRDLQAQISKSVQKEKELISDKASLVTTMHGLMSDAAKFKDALEKETSVRAKCEKDLAADEAKIAKLTPKPKPKSHPKPKMAQFRRVANATLSHKHEGSEGSQVAHMNTINHYIIKSQETSIEDDSLPFDAPLETQAETSKDVSAASSTDDEIGEVWNEMDAEQPQEDDLKVQASNPPLEGHTKIIANVAPMTSESPSKAEKGLKAWLGFKTTDAGNIQKDANGLKPIDALSPEGAKSQEKKAEMQKHKVGVSKKQEDEDGGDVMDELLSQAKAQLKAMDDTDPTGSAESSSTP